MGGRSTGSASDDRCEGGTPAIALLALTVKPRHSNHICEKIVSAYPIANLPRHGDNSFSVLSSHCPSHSSNRMTRAHHWAAALAAVCLIAWATPGYCQEAADKAALEL